MSPQDPRGEPESQEQFPAKPETSTIVSQSTMCFLLFTSDDSLDTLLRPHQPRYPHLINHANQHQNYQCDVSGHESQ